MFDQFLSKANELVTNGQSFAIAVVVRYEAPISGKPGNKAIVFPDGKIWGWIGGGCAQPVVVKEALKALADGQPRLIRISPSSSPEEGIVDYTMTCHSGGTLDIFIEPVLPKPHILILGRSPVAKTLSRLGKAIGYAVSVVAPEADRQSFPDSDLVQADLDLSQLKTGPQTFIVVSTQGEADEEALEKAVLTKATYVAFVASKTKASKILDFLKERGIASDRLSQVRAPAGLDIRAASPEEIAVSILAEIIQVNGTRAAARKDQAQLASPIPKQEATDPICGMTVDVSRAKHKSEFRGKAFYFCCVGCKQKFDNQPDKYALL
jgi:xanthine dehydrogenase accessory factor